MPPSPIQAYDSLGSPSESGSTPDDNTSDSSTGSPTSPPSPTSPRAEGGSRTGPDGVITFAPLPKQSVRTALILDRFSMSCPIIYCSNDTFLSTTQIMGRPFFDFVTKRDEALVRSWIDAVKGWGVNERGQPSDGGFGFGKFHLLPQGRDSVYVYIGIRYPCSSADLVNHLSERLEPESQQPPPRHGRTAARGSVATSPHHTSRVSVVHTVAPAPARQRQQRPRAAVHTAEEEVVVDAIFSAHSDGLMVILRHASQPSGGAQPPKSAVPVAGLSKPGPSSSSSSSTIKYST
jgi:hypothetical protein